MVDDRRGSYFTSPGILFFLFLVSIPFFFRFPCSSPPQQISVRSWLVILGWLSMHNFPHGLVSFADGPTVTQDRVPARPPTRPWWWLPQVWLQQDISVCSSLGLTQEDGGPSPRPRHCSCYSSCFCFCSFFLFFMFFTPQLCWAGAEVGAGGLVAGLMTLGLGIIDR